MNEPQIILRQVHKDTGYEILVVRSHMGVYCGYVRVPETHPWYKMYYHHLSPDIPEQFGEWKERILMDLADKGVTIPPNDGTSPEDLIEVHGGVTFSGQPWGVEEGYWFGFDCGHAFDFNPELERIRNELEHEHPELVGPYQASLRRWNPDDVLDECAKMARQLKDVADIIHNCIPPQETQNGQDRGDSEDCGGEC